VLIGHFMALLPIVYCSFFSRTRISLRGIIVYCSYMIKHKVNLVHLLLVVVMLVFLFIHYIRIDDCGSVND
jgi:hypothetical protein